ncbi:hypothetical protein A4X13_0g7595 [Tilletia indica]|uniref:Uncharacterized protein n=1 Tax=Tilletia indica TaxID=43049 RepID=A0A177TSD5_9BASI|nr:hypothetical protein A4X13_0g7595 [Tilletia indica]
MSSQEVLEVARQLQGININAANNAATTMINFAPKPDAGGTKGKAVKLKSNMFAISFGSGGPPPKAPQQAARTGGGGGKGGRGGKGGAKATPRATTSAPTIYQYDVVVRGLNDDIEQGREGGSRAKLVPTRLLFEIVQAALTELRSQPEAGVTDLQVRAFAFDGRKIAYTAHRLPLDAITVDTTLPPKRDLPEIAGYPSTRPDPAPAADSRGGNRPFTVEFKLTKQIALSDLIDFCQGGRQAIMGAGDAVPDNVSSALQALEVALRHSQQQHCDVIIGGRRFFTSANRTAVGGTGSSIWKGFFQSARPTSLGPVINLDVSFSAFLDRGDLASLCVALLGRGGGGGGGGGGGRGRGAPRGRGGPGRGGAPAPQGGHQANPMMIVTNLSVGDRQALRKHLYGVRLRLLHRPSSRVEMFESLTNTSASQTTFKRGDQTVSVAAYFLSTYNYTLRFPNAPCVKLRGKGGFVPVELCYVMEGNRVPPLALNAAQTATMIDVARQDPQSRQASVVRLRNEVVQYERDDLLESWGVQVSNDPVRVEGRQLPPPRVMYGGNKTDAPRDGAWNLMGKLFHTPGEPLASWAIINFTRCNPQDVQAFGGQLVASMARLGIRARPPVYASGGLGHEAVKPTLVAASKQAFEASGAGPARKPPQLLVCLLEANQPALYASIKSVSMKDLYMPVPTQCINVRKAKIGMGTVADQYVANVAMKINVKIGGGNHAVAPQDLPGLAPGTMLMGADVTHPPPGLGLDSIAASVATVDGKRMIYGHEVRLQRNAGRGQSQEIILSMKSMVETHLKRWEAKNQGQLPTAILMYRDGVSEGQFAAAKDVELRSIRDAIHAVRPGYKMKVTYVVCGKRHHVRFSAEDPKDTDRSGNVRAGTVVDTTVTNPVAFEFFLQAHAGLIGTAKPTRYIVLEDEIGFSSDALQTVTNALCYSYSRATRSVSLPPPAYYSDILAEKARALLWPDADARSMGTSSSGESRPYEPLEQSKAMELMTRINLRPNFGVSAWYM